MFFYFIFFVLYFFFLVQHTKQSTNLYGSMYQFSNQIHKLFLINQFKRNQNRIKQVEHKVHGQCSTNLYRFDQSLVADSVLLVPRRRIRKTPRHLYPSNNKYKHTRKRTPNKKILNQTQTQENFSTKLGFQSPNLETSISENRPEVREEGDERKFLKDLGFGGCRSLERDFEVWFSSPLSDLK